LIASLQTSLPAFVQKQEGPTLSIKGNSLWKGSSFESSYLLLVLWFVFAVLSMNAGNEAENWQTYLRVTRCCRHSLAWTKNKPFPMRCDGCSCGRRAKEASAIEELAAIIFSQKAYVVSNTLSGKRP
jgi:hypothetical protein